MFMFMLLLLMLFLCGGGDDDGVVGVVGSIDYWKLRNVYFELLCLFSQR